MNSPPCRVFLLLMSVSLTACLQQSVRPIEPIAIEGKGGDVQGMSLSYGMIKKHLSVNHTTQADVLKLFGSLSI